MEKNFSGFLFALILMIEALSEFLIIAASIVAASLMYGNFLGQPINTSIAETLLWVFVSVSLLGGVIGRIASQTFKKNLDL